MPTKEEVLSLARRYLPQAATVSAMHDRGLRHESYEIDHHAILKLPRPGTPVAEIAREAFVLARLEESGFRQVPRMLGFETGGDDLPHLLTTRIPGSPLPQHGPTWPPEVVGQVASFLSRLHNLPVERLQGSEQIETLDVRRFWRNGIEWLVSRGALSGTQLKDLDSRFETGVKNFPSDQPSLLHGDLWAQHCFFDPSVSQLTGIIDFADSMLGPRAWEFASPGYGGWQPALAEAYAELTGAGATFHEEVEFYRRVRFVCLPAWADSWAEPALLQHYLHVSQTELRNWLK